MDLTDPHGYIRGISPDRHRSGFLVHGLVASLVAMQVCSYRASAGSDRVFLGRPSQPFGQDGFGSVEIAVVVRATAGALPRANV